MLTFSEDTGVADGGEVCKLAGTVMFIEGVGIIIDGAVPTALVPVARMPVELAGVGAIPDDGLDAMTVYGLNKFVKFAGGARYELEAAVPVGSKAVKFTEMAVLTVEGPVVPVEKIPVELVEGKATALEPVPTGRLMVDEGMGMSEEKAGTLVGESAVELAEGTSA